MKKWLVAGLLLILVGGGAGYYFELGVSPQTKRDRFLEKAKNFAAIGKTNEAVIEYKNALKVDPAHAESHYELAMLLLKKSDVRAGYSEIVRATDLDPKLIKARYQLAVMHVYSKDLKRAKEELRKLQEEQDKDAYETRYLAAQIAGVEKEPDRAIEELRDALKREPRKGQIGIDIGQIHTAKRDFKAAEEFFLQAINIDPKLHRARVALAQLFFAAGETEGRRRTVGRNQG